ncbi:hypothetical protein LMG26857_03653 [Achromobacter anxifer]|nr:hypothetical protein LMG26857_03653 [Achromobacter anxifer]
MGGNALSVPSVRLTVENYTRLENDLLAKLREMYPQTKFAAVQSYRSKADFGDLDMLVGDSAFDSRKAAQALGAVEVVPNGPVTSFGLRVNLAVQDHAGNLFQVDFIKVTSAEFEYAKGYFAFNDLGNLVGRVAHKMGLAHKHNGLYFYVRDGDYMFREILLTEDYGAALSAMGYDPVRFAAGFDTPEDLFEYTASSPFFNRDIFLLDNRNAKSRVRDSKRKTYMQFLDWCEGRSVAGQHVFPKDKAAWLPRLYACFPGFQAEHEKALADLAKARAVKAKFNGGMVGEWTGLANKELGLVMKSFRESFPTQDALQDYVLATDEDDLKSRVLELKSQLFA